MVIAGGLDRHLSTHIITIFMVVQHSAAVKIVHVLRRDGVNQRLLPGQSALPEKTGRARAPFSVGAGVISSRLRTLCWMCAVDDKRPAPSQQQQQQQRQQRQCIYHRSGRGERSEPEEGESESVCVCVREREGERIYGHRPSMATQTTASCTGSTLLQPISEIINLPLDQVNFVACQLFALLMAVWFRIYLHPSKTSPFIRHVVATLLGFYLALFCFGWYSLHFLVQSGLSYSVMVFAGLEHMHKYCFIVTLSYLILCQITRVYVFDYGMYSADFTGPMMVITQKITSLAFEIHDGLTKRDAQLTPTQKYLAIRRMPSLLEYLSYNCNFMGILAGPTCSYNDYKAFIEGTGYQPRHQENANGKENGKYKQSEPSPKNDVISKLCTCAVSLAIYLSLCKLLPVEHAIDDDFVSSTPFHLQVIYLYLAMLALRPKYYFVWTLADAINNAAGFGFNGYNKDGSPRWDLISNLRILDIEFATSFKSFLDNWNIQTALWLKRVCYERCAINPTAATFLLSAMWHGVYPGYYLTFLTGIAMTMAARAVRHNIRPYFLVSDSYKNVYDVVTWASTQIAISYTVAPFVLLAVGPSLKFYRSWYFCLHLLCLLTVLVLPVKPRRRQAKEQQDGPQKDGLQDNQTDHNSTDNNCNQKDKAT